MPKVFVTVYFRSVQEKLPRSSSIDSMVDMVWNTECDTNLVSLPKHLMVQEPANRRESLLSPRRTKQSRGINCKMIESKKSGIYFMCFEIVLIVLVSITHKRRYLYYTLLTSRGNFKERRVAINWTFVRLWIFFFSCARRIACIGKEKKSRTHFHNLLCKRDHVDDKKFIQMSLKAYHVQLNL